MMVMSTETSCDDSFKRPGAVPFKWESQPGVPKHAVEHLAGVPKHAVEHPAADPPSSRPKLQPPPSGARRRHHHHYPRSASASPTVRRPSSVPRTASASPSWKRPTVAVVSTGCFPAASPLKRRDVGKSKSKGHPEEAPPRSATAAAARGFSIFSSPQLGRSSPPAPAEVEPRRRSLGISGPLGMPPRVAEEDWARRGGKYHRAAQEGWARRGYPAFLSPLGRYHRAAEEAVSATRWLF